MKVYNNEETKENTLEILKENNMAVHLKNEQEYDAFTSWLYLNGEQFANGMSLVDESIYFVHQNNTCLYYIGNEFCQVGWGYAKKEECARLDIDIIDFKDVDITKRPKLNTATDMIKPNTLNHD